MFHTISTRDLIDFDLDESLRTTWRKPGHVTAAARDRAHARELLSIRRAARKKP
ncbi:MAG: hypothetical protein JWM34_3381 [Ilumatobacteraceae bacterium]|nr:hypothetical protein [Ilumatobacteraceae bacterium]